MKINTLICVGITLFFAITESQTFIFGLLYFLFYVDHIMLFFYTSETSVR